MANPSIAYATVKKVNSEGITDAQDILAAEEPLETRLMFYKNGTPAEQSISVTMRTPGNDTELAMGFLFTEGIIRSSAEVCDIRHKPGSDDNVITVSLQPDVQPDIARLERHFYTTSSCGVCGKTSIEAVRTICPVSSSSHELKLKASLVYELPQRLRGSQQVFESTGGLHASAVFDEEGRLLISREDVGRHNALDKLIGTALQQDKVPLNRHILLLSGRASFELVQKAAMAGIGIVAAVGAPSSLAVQLAKECNMTLIGFVRDARFNIYSGSERIGQ